MQTTAHSADFLSDSACASNGARSSEEDDFDEYQTFDEFKSLDDSFMPEIQYGNFMTTPFISSAFDPPSPGNVAKMDTAFDESEYASLS